MSRFGIYYLTTFIHEDFFLVLFTEVFLKRSAFKKFLIYFIISKLTFYIVKVFRDSQENYLASILTKITSVLLQNISYHLYFFILIIFVTIK
jgi:hypothetical protein